MSADIFDAKSEVKYVIIVTEKGEMHFKGEFTESDIQTAINTLLKLLMRVQEERAKESL